MSITDRWALKPKEGTLFNFSNYEPSVRQASAVILRNIEFLNPFFHSAETLSIRVQDGAAFDQTINITLPTWKISTSFSNSITANNFNVYDLCSYVNTEIEKALHGFAGLKPAGLYCSFDGSKINFHIIKSEMNPGTPPTWFLTFTGTLVLKMGFTPSVAQSPAQHQWSSNEWDSQVKGEWNQFFNPDSVYVISSALTLHSMDQNQPSFVVTEIPIQQNTRGGDSLSYELKKTKVFPLEFKNKKVDIQIISGSPHHTLNSTFLDAFTDLSFRKVELEFDIVYGDLNSDFDFSLI